MPAATGQRAKRRPSRAVSSSHQLVFGVVLLLQGNNASPLGRILSFHSLGSRRRALLQAFGAPNLQADQTQQLVRLRHQPGAKTLDPSKCLLLHRSKASASIRPFSVVAPSTRRDRSLLADGLHRGFCLPLKKVTLATCSRLSTLSSPADTLATGSSSRYSIIVTLPRPSCTLCSWITFPFSVLFLSAPTLLLYFSHTSVSHCACSLLPSSCFLLPPFTQLILLAPHICALLPPPFLSASPTCCSCS
eukprot:CAMPEP_0177741210 /NCGR_PEP_ID=MMETSP0484_2-20121128/27990_1 /TAXON_ID=354590 /ORGANISM="Rhodomonas lens, Strain RHODO" /LENGTH=246 /DNA_ID=CAMNT_0019255429 /DNA_START=62 /DNA_END=799 /DNA_ORIENTATION=+